MRVLVLTRLDYSNSILLRLPDSQLNCLQMVQIAAAQKICQIRWRDDVTPQLRDRLHGLRIPEQIVFKRCWFIHRALYDPLKASSQDPIH